MDINESVQHMLLCGVFSGCVAKVVLVVQSSQAL